MSVRKGASADAIESALAEAVNERGDWKYGVVPPGRYAQGKRAPIVWVLLCAGCGGFEPFTTDDYDGFLSGRCQGCGMRSRELHRFRAWIDTAAGCNCRGGHDQAVGDVWAADNAVREHQEGPCA